MKLVEVKERWLMCWLCFMGRGVTQAVRVVLGALMPYIATDLELDHKQKGTVLAAFAAGYMCTQVLGGYASDRYGGRGPILLPWGALASCSPWRPGAQIRMDRTAWRAACSSWGYVKGRVTPRWARC